MKPHFIPFLDLSRESAHNRCELDQALARVLARGWYVLGPELEALEREFAVAFGVPFAVGVGSGTDALTLAIEASGALTPGEGKRSSPQRYPQLSQLCRYAGPAQLLGLWMSILPLCKLIHLRLNLSLGKKTRAIIPVHLYGHACDLQSILELALRRHLTVIEDACQAHGSRLADQPLGAFGQAAGFSFYPTKNMGALGDAGMVLSRDEDLILRVKKLRHGGQSSPYRHELLGCCSRLDEIQAAVLRLKLRTLEERNCIRRNLAARYDEAFEDIDLVLLPQIPGLLPNRHLYPIRTSRRDDLRLYLKEHGIETLVHYPIPLPFQPALERFVLPGQEFPAAQKASREILSLPLYPELTEQELQYTIEAVRNFFKA